MEIKLEIPKYSTEAGFKSCWEDSFRISVNVDNECINLIANNAGLISLGIQLLTLAQENVPSGYHLHFDEYNSLEKGSCELIIQKQ